MHDPTAWDTIRKTTSETFQTTMESISKSPNLNPSNVINHHNILTQNLQTQPVISRLQYTNSSLRPNYYTPNTFDQVKLGCKILVLDVKLNNFMGNFLKIKEIFLSFKTCFCC